VPSKGYRPWFALLLFRQLRRAIRNELVDRFVGRADFEGAGFYAGVFRHQFHRVRHVAGFEEEDAAEDFFGFGEGAVDGVDLAVDRAERLGLRSGACESCAGRYSPSSLTSPSRGKALRSCSFAGSLKRSP
jgi:hypothetical protein